MGHGAPTTKKAVRRLAAWYETHARALPWRSAPHATNAYAVLVSEMMLQQTRVETALPYFERWMKRFPDWQALAQADEQAVMAAWAGLGYYRRARALHAAAGRVVTKGVPASAENWQEFPGIGPYTAAAVASIAQSEAVAAVDGNATRVMARLAAVEGRPNRAPAKAAIRAAAQSAMETATRAGIEPGTWNQAVMELGATVCAPVPRCDACPLQAGCAAYATGEPTQYPAPTRRTPPKLEAHHFARIEEGGRVLLVRRNAGLLAGMWMLPGGPVVEPLGALVRDQTGAEVTLGPIEGRTKQRFTHRIWDMQIYQGQDPRGALAPQAAWFTREELDEAAMPAATWKALQAGL